MQVFADTRKSAADCSWLTAACWRRAGVGVTQQSARMPPRDLPPLVSSPSCRSARSGSAESIYVDSAADRYGLNRPKDLIDRSDGRVQRKLWMIGLTCMNVVADRFRVRPGRAAFFQRPREALRFWRSTACPQGNLWPIKWPGEAWGVPTGAQGPKSGPGAHPPRPWCPFFY